MEDIFALIETMIGYLKEIIALISKLFGNGEETPEEPSEIEE